MPSTPESPKHGQLWALPISIVSNSHNIQLLTELPFQLQIPLLSPTWSTRAGQAFSKAGKAAAEAGADGGSWIQPDLELQVGAQDHSWSSWIAGLPTGC